eukprot:5256434-Amphidinium_carterae.1
MSPVALPRGLCPQSIPVQTFQVMCQLLVPTLLECWHPARRPIGTNTAPFTIARRHGSKTWRTWLLMANQMCRKVPSRIGKSTTDKAT